MSLGEVACVADPGYPLRQLAEVDDEQSVRRVIGADIGERIPATVRCVPKLMNFDVPPGCRLSIDEANLAWIFGVRDVVNGGTGAVANDRVLSMGIQVHEAPDIRASGRWGPVSDVRQQVDIEARKYSCKSAAANAGRCIRLQADLISHGRLIQSFRIGDDAEALCREFGGKFRWYTDQC